MANPTVDRSQRHVRSHHCPVCDGFDEADRGQGKRCSGFTTADGAWCNCSREDYAGSIAPNAAGLYGHRMQGSCKCGTTHGEDASIIREKPAEYVYQDERWRDVLRVCILGHGSGKKVWQQHWDGHAWQKGRGTARRILYRLPELLVSMGPVYVVEGERDVETLRARGYTATCNAEGAGKWRLYDASPLRGREVRVVADKDGEKQGYAGQKHALDIQKSLEGAANVTLWQCPEAKDVTDHLSQGGTIDELVPMVAPGGLPEPKAKPILAVVPKPGIPWRQKLHQKMFKGKPTGDFKKTEANIVTILSHDEGWRGILAYDEFAETIVTTRAPPWRECDAPHGGAKAGDWTDTDTIRLQCWLSEEFNIDASAGAVLGAVQVTSESRRIHPVREWLDGLRWDGRKRVPTWLIDVMGCEDCSYVREVGQAWAISAVARAYSPGCKVDTVLVLEGKPGTFKSSVLRALVGDEWFLEMSISDVSNKDAMQILRRKWIAEFPEIDGLSRTEQAAVKSYFSRQVDTYRASYGRGSKDYPRQTVFAATTNKSEWITDETGGTGRRMWPVRCPRGDVSLAANMREQFWAEARARFQSGEAWHITDPELIEAAREEQDARFRADPWESLVAEWLSKPVNVSSKAELGVSTSDVLDAIGLDRPKRDNGHSARVGAILRRLGWVPGKHPEAKNGARVRLYRPQDGAATNGHTLVPMSDPPDGYIDVDLTEDSFPDVSEGHAE